MGTLVYKRNIDSGAALQSLFGERGRGNQFSNDGFDMVYDALCETSEGEYDVDVIEVCGTFGEETYADFMADCLDLSDMTDYIVYSYPDEFKEWAKDHLDGYAEMLDEDGELENMEMVDMNDVISFFKDCAFFDDGVLDEVDSREVHILGTTSEDTVVFAY